MWNLDGGGGQFSNTSGNNGEFFVSTDNGSDVSLLGWVLDTHNDTCADYFARVVVTTAGSAPDTADATPE